MKHGRYSFVEMCKRHSWCTCVIFFSPSRIRHCLSTYKWRKAVNSRWNFNNCEMTERHEHWMIRKGKHFVRSNRILGMILSSASQRSRCGTTASDMAANRWEANHIHIDPQHPEISNAENCHAGQLQKNTTRMFFATFVMLRSHGNTIRIMQPPVLRISFNNSWPNIAC